MLDIRIWCNLSTNVFLFVYPDHQAAETRQVCINMKQNLLKICFMVGGRLHV